MSIGDKIKELRNKKDNMTQKDLALLVGVSEIAIRKYEKGDRTPKFETLLKIADALDAPVQYILGELALGQNFEYNVHFDDSIIISNNDTPKSSMDTDYEISADMKVMDMLNILDKTIDDTRQQYIAKKAQYDFISFQCVKLHAELAELEKELYKLHDTLEKLELERQEL